MSSVKKAFAVSLLALNTTMSVFLAWTQVIIAAEGRRYGAAIVGGAILALFLVFPTLMILGGVGM
jgi:hypothetical protein